MGHTALTAHKLESLKYWPYDAELAKLTFVFTGDLCSPPLGTYMNGDPESSLKLPNTITKMVFMAWNDGYNYNLNLITVNDKISTKASKKSAHITESLIMP